MLKEYYESHKTTNTRVLDKCSFYTSRLSWLLFSDKEQELRTWWKKLEVFFGQWKKVEVIVKLDIWIHVDLNGRSSQTSIIYIAITINVDLNGKRARIICDSNSFEN